jgi:uncharacterized repeat protein (TIGR02543 family)
MKITSPSKFVAALVLPLALLFTACPPPIMIISKYIVTFDKNGGDTNASPTTLTVAKSDTTIDALPTAPTRTGYTFTGWNTKANGSGTTFTANTTVTGDITVYAQWHEMPATWSYTVTFDKNGGGTEASPRIMTVAQPATTVGELPTAPTRTGYTFTGWNTKADVSGTSFTASSVVTSNITVYAQWQKNWSYTVTFDKNGGDADASPKTMTVANPATTVGELPTAPTRSGYAFTGWNTKANGSGDNFTASTAVTSNITVYAQGYEMPAPWSYTVTFDKNGGDTEASPKILTVAKPNTTVGELPTAPTRSGEYTFIGWNTKADGSGTAFTASTAVIGSITVYAQWQKNWSYTVTFNKNGGDTDASPKTLAVANPATTVSGLPTAPTRSGYAFTSWNTTASGSGTAFTATTVVTNSITVYAQWQISNPDNSTNSAEETRSFYASNLITNLFYSVNAVKLAESQHCIVYADAKENVSQNVAKAIVEEYETKIHTQITDAFGMFEDVDGNGKVIFLLLDIIDGYTKVGSSYVAGFFQSYHMFKNSKSYPYSNEADMLFLDIYPQEAGSEGFYSTMAHEFQHLINFSNTSFYGGNMEDTWIDEGLATAAEYIYNGHQESRINLFNNDPFKSIRYGNNFFVWDGFWESETAAGANYDPVANYATVYLFFQWLRIHANNGVKIYRDIIGSSYRDYRAVTEAAQSQIDFSLGDWETLLRTWMLANVYNGTSGLLGYRNEIKTEVRAIPSSSWKLYPGEGVFSLISKTGGSFRPSSGSGNNIRYAGFVPSSTDINLVGPSYNGQYLLTFNANSNNNGVSETGYLAQGSASVRSTGDSMRIGRTLDDEIEAAPLGPFPIDVQFNPDGTVRRGKQ